MREIKFRAWWKEAKLMADVELWRVSDVVIIVPVVSRIPGHTHERQVLEEEQYELMQYTGLKDKNGKEIYEGDIVNYEYYSERENRKDREEIKYIQDLCGFAPFCLKDDFDANVDILNVEIIGNIYENPELLDNEV